MVISLLVLLVPVVLFVGVYQVISGRNLPVEVDPSGELAAAEEAGMPVTVPAGLAAGWVPVSAAFRTADAGGTVRVGYLTPDANSVQLVQSTAPAEELLAAELPDSAAPAGAVDVAGRSWQLYEADDDHLALVLLEPDRTVIAHGRAPETELRDLALSVS
jgi:hypothetical protein